jgi:hypothetical protein
MFVLRIWAAFVLALFLQHWRNFNGRSARADVASCANEMGFLSEFVFWIKLVFH